MEKAKGVALSDARRLAIQHVDEHRFLADYLKPLAKEIVLRHFASLSASIGNLELGARRALADKPRKPRKRKKL
jgi:hypothetical protein